MCEELTKVMSGVQDAFTLTPMNERARAEMPQTARRKTKTFYGVNQLKYATESAHYG